jgi:hypothetical protein
MKRFGPAFFLVLICAAPAFAAVDFPPRKAGLWQMNTVTSNGHTVSMQECVDAQTDQAMQSRFASAPQRNCPKRDVQKSGDTITIDAVCTVAGNTTSHHMVITGNFDSGYTVTMTNQVQGSPAPRTVNMTAKWLGPCAAGQRPGDMILPNGKTINILDMQKMMPGAFGAPPPPHQ